MKTGNSSTSGQTTTQKESKGNFGIEAGYNLFFAWKLSFTPMEDYNWENLKNTETSVTNKQKGWGIEIGLRY